MIRSTQITRLSKLLPLCEETFDDDTLLETLPDYKLQSKAITRTLNPQEPRVTIESGLYNFHALVDQGIAYICIADRICSRSLVFSYLETLARTFYSEHGDRVESCQRPYAFLSFEHEIGALRKSFRTGPSSALSQLNDELGQVKKILTVNIQDVLQRGEKLDKLTTISSHLATQSKKYAKQTQDLHWQALYEKYGTPLVLLLLFIFFLYVWWSWF